MTDKIWNKRRHYFIKKKFQRNFIIKFCILVIIGSILSGGIIYTISKSTATASFENSRLTIKSTADFILPAILLSSIIVILFIGLASVAIALFASHKIAGPLYRIEKDIQEVANGNLKKRFNLRKGDEEEIKVLAEGLNKMTESLNSHITRVKAAVSELESAFNTADQVSAELKDKLENVKKAISKLNT